MSSVLPRAIPESVPYVLRPVNRHHSWNVLFCRSLKFHFPRITCSSIDFQILRTFGNFFIDNFKHLMNGNTINFPPFCASRKIKPFQNSDRKPLLFQDVAFINTINWIVLNKTYRWGNQLIAEFFDSLDNNPPIYYVVLLLCAWYSRRIL